MDVDTVSSLTAATDWVRAALLGTVATTIAVIAVAVVGAIALSGRVPARRALSVILGCFVLVGAPTIAAGLVGLRGEQTEPPVMSEVAAVARPVVRGLPGTSFPSGPAGTYDPYAGAAVR